MCLDILKNPAAALEKAKKTRSSRKAWLALIEASILLALAAAIVSYVAFGSALIAVTAIIATFVLSLVFGVILAWVVKLAATTLGGKGEFREGLVVVSYSMIFLGSGLFVASLLTRIPFVGIVLGALVLLATAATGLATFYRGIKEMFRTDMIVALIAVSVVVLAFLIALWGTFGLNMLGNLNSVLSATALASA